MALFNIFRFRGMKKRDTPKQTKITDTSDEKHLETFLIRIQEDDSFRFTSESSIPHDDTNDQYL